MHDQDIETYARHSLFIVPFVGCLPWGMALFVCAPQRGSLPRIRYSCMLCDDEILLLNTRGRSSMNQINGRYWTV